MATIQPRLQIASPRHTILRDSAIKLPLILAAALFYVLLIPEEANFRLGGVLWSPYRLLLLFGIFFVIALTSKQRLRFAWPDLAVVVGCFWIGLASYVTSGSLTTALVQGGGHAVDIGLAYFFMRFAIRTPRQLRLFLILIAPGVALMGAIVFIESISGQHIVRPIFSALTGTPIRGGVETRLGLTRGVGSFPHPILAGISLSSFLTIYWMSGLRGWPKLAGTLGSFGAIFTLSSAALLGLVLGTVLMVYDWLCLRIRNFTWAIFLAASAALYVLVESFSNSGFFSLLVRFASLNTVSAYNRVLIWKYGSESVVKHPFFGIGYDDWERPIWMNWSTSGSVDHFWLILAMRFGLPVSILFLFATIIAILLVCRKSAMMTPVDARLMRGVAISLAIFALGIISVSLWLNALVWFFMLVGMAVSLGSQPAPTRAFVRSAAPLSAASAVLPS